MPTLYPIRSLQYVLRNILLCGMLCISNHVKCQNYWENYELFNTRSGLPNNIILSIEQDNRNLLWIGTNNGLCIYDGFEFEVIKNIFPKGNPWDNAFCCLYKDSRGNIWLSTLSGRIAVYHTTGDSFTYFKTRSQRKSYISAFHEDAEGKIWMGSNEGELYTAEYGKKELTWHMSWAQNILNIQAIAPDTVLLNSFYKYKIPYPLYKKRQPQQPSSYYILSGDNTGSIYLYKNGKQVRIKDNEVFNRQNYIYKKTSDGRLFLASTRLVQEYDPDGNLRHKIAIYDAPDNQSEDITNTIFEDATGILWIGTNFGLLKVDKDKYNFQKFANRSVSHNLSDNYVRSIYVDSGNSVWVGYKNGPVNKLVPLPGGKMKTVTLKNATPTIPHTTINAICQLNSGIILFGGQEGLAFIKRSNQTNIDSFYMYDDKGKKLYAPETWSIIQDRKGYIWIGTKTSGLFIVDPHTYKARHYTYICHRDTIGEERHTPIWQIFQDSKGSIWLGTEYGLDSAVFSSGGDYPDNFYHIHEHYKGEAGRKVWTVVEDKYHRLWIGTTENGFSLLDKANREFITYNQNNGLASNTVCGILNGPGKYLWISTLNGIMRFDLTNYSFMHLTENDGLINNDFNFNACYRSPSGLLFFGTKTGLVVFHPDSIKQEILPGIPVVIRAFNLWNKTYLRNLADSQTIKLNHTQNFFSCRFALPEYKTTARHHFKYMLQGFEESWTTTNAKNPMAVYTNIPPGRYTFLVQGSPDGQHWEPKYTTLYIVIAPAFWQQPLFIITTAVFLALLAAYILYLVFNNFLRKEREKARINQQFAELELRALQAQMNPHFVFNCINAIQHFILTHDEMAANEYLSKFARLMRLSLEASTNKYILLEEEIELLKLYVELEKLRFEDKFEYSFHIDSNLDLSSEEIPSMLLQPFVENAINHGIALSQKYCRLNIYFRRENNKIICTIDDNGVGRKKAAAIQAANGKKYTSRGMQLIEERVKTYNFIDEQEIQIQIVDKQLPEEGTYATIIIALNNRKN